LKKALKYFEDETVLFKELYEAFPQNVTFKNGLAVSYLKLGDLSLTKNNKILAQQYFVQAQKILQELALAAPQYAEFQKNLVTVNSDLADF
jgi:hypothetical protein